MDFFDEADPFEPKEIHIKTVLNAMAALHFVVGILIWGFGVSVDGITVQDPIIISKCCFLIVFSFLFDLSNHLRQNGSDYHAAS